MKSTTHKLFGGTFLVAMTVFGLTVLSSSSSDDTRVLGFIDDSCSSELQMTFNSLGDMIDYDGTEDTDGFVWNFLSYYTYAELLYEESFECYQFDASTAGSTTGEAEPEPEPSPSPKPKPGGLQGGSDQPVSGTPPVQALPPPPPPRCHHLTQAKLDEIRTCWTKKVANAGLNGWHDLGSIRKDAVKKTTWQLSFVDKGDGLGYGLTQAKKGAITQKFLGVEVYIFPLQIGEEERIVCEHLAEFAQMHEQVHVFQYWLEATDNDGLAFPSPYELYDNEVEAHDTAVRWWNALHPHPDPNMRAKNISSAPYPKLSSRVTHRFKNGRGEHAGEFLRKKNQYQDYEQQKAEGTLTETDKEKMDKLKLWFEHSSRKVPALPGKNALYSEALNTGCE